MAIDESTLPAQVRNFLTATRENARSVGEWDEDFIAHLLSVSVDRDGTVTISDNFERFFCKVYTYTYGGKWLIRDMFSESGDRPYSYAQVMGDAAIMYTG